MKYIFVYITNPNEEEAKKIAKMLLDKKLIACANIFPINSLYNWQGKFCDEKEFVLIGKTIENKFIKIKDEVEKTHSYKCPCIIKLPIEVNEKYGEWLMGEID